MLCLHIGLPLAFSALQDIYLMIAGSFGVSACLEQTGAAAAIANLFITVSLLRCASLPPRWVALVDSRRGAVRFYSRVERRVCSCSAASVSPFWEIRLAGSACTTSNNCWLPRADWQECWR